MVTVVVATILAQTALGVPANAQVLAAVAWALATYGVAAHSPRRTALAGLAVVAVLVGVLVVTAILPTFSDLLYVAAIFTLVPWVAGRVYRARRTEALEFARRAARAEAEGELLAQQVLETERRRIARELHDIIAHSLSLMVLQAGAAGEVLDRSPERARAALETVARTGREALVEMKRLLAVLRAPDTETGLGPQPGLAELPALVEHVRDTGLDVTLTVRGDRIDAPPGVELSIFRIVQEGLTNVIKHAGAGHASVTVSAAPRHIDVEILDDGRGGAVARDNGHGLVGMRERVALFGGELTAGPAAGGFAVHARFPLDVNGGT